MKDYIERWNNIMHDDFKRRNEAFKNAIEEGIKDAEDYIRRKEGKRDIDDYINRKEAIRLIMEYQGGAMDKPTAKKVLENMDGVEICEDTISRQALMKEFSDFVRESNNSDFAQTPT